MVASLLQPHIWTANLLFQGLIDGLSIALIAMGIVLIYRSSRVINFAVGDMGVPSAFVLAVAVANSNVPYWLALIFALILGALTGTIVELTVIRRLAKAPRVIVLVATIGVAEFARAVTFTLPTYSSGKYSTQYPTPISSSWELGSVHVTGPQVLVLVLVPAITIGLWWLLGHTRFGESVRAAATNADLARLTGVSPKMMSTAVWTIAGFLSTISIILIATNETSAQLVSIGPDTLLEGMTAALIGRMVSFPKAALGALLVAEVSRIVYYNFPNDTGVASFLMFMLVLVLVARMSRADDTGGESFAFAPRVPAIPERLREIWWVRRMPQLLGAFALAIVIVAPFIVTQSSRHQTWGIVLSFAICAVSVIVLTGWGGQLSLGQMAIAGIGALSAATLVRGARLNVGWRDNRLAKGSIRPLPMSIAVIAAIVAIGAFSLIFAGGFTKRQRIIALITAVGAVATAAVFIPVAIDPSETPHQMPFVLALIGGAIIACAVAVAVGIGALRVKGLLLAISTMALAVTAGDYLFYRPILDPDSGLTVELARGKLGPVDLTLHNRAYYFFVLAVLVILVIMVSHLRRTGIGRIIVGVRENEPAAAALTVSPIRAKLIAFALGGFIAGLGGAMLGGVVTEIGFSQRFFTFSDSLTIVSMAVIGGLGSLAGAIIGALWVIGLPTFWPNNQTVPLFTSSIGLLIILMYFPGGFTQLGYWIRGAILTWLEKRMPEEAVKTITAPPASLRRVEPAPLVLDSGGNVLSTTGLSVRFGGVVAVDDVDFDAKPGEVIGLIGTNGAGKSTLLNAMGGFVPSSGTVRLLGADISSYSPHKRAAVGLGRTFQAATLFPELTVRETIQLALEARKRSSFWGVFLALPPAVKAERAKRAQAAELIDYLGLGRYADRYIAELSTGTRRIVELTSVLAVAPRVICLDEPTAGVAQREAEAFGPLIKHVQQELEATLIVVEHDLPMILSISDRVYCMEAGSVIAVGTPDAIRNDPKVISSYLGTDDRAILRSNA